MNNAIEGSNSFQSISQLSASFVERENRQLENLQWRKKQELQQMVDYMVKMQEMRNKNELKLKEAQDREERRQRLLQKRRQEQEERRMLEEERKRQQMLKEEEEFRQKANADYERAQRVAQEQASKEIERQTETKIIEEKKKLRREEFKRKTEEKVQNLNSHQAEKLRAFEEKEQKRNEAMQRALQDRQTRSKKAKAEKELRIRIAQDNFTKILYAKQAKLTAKQKEIEDKLRQQHIEKEKAKRLFKIGDNPSDNLRKLFTYEQGIVKKKQEEIIRKIEIENFRRGKEAKILEKAEKIQREHELKEANVAKVKKQQETQVRIKKELNKMREKDSKDVFNKISKQKEEFRQKVINKIQQENSRVESFRAVKKQAMEQRRIDRERARSEKRKILSMFDELQRKNIHRLSAELKHFGFAPTVFPPTHKLQLNRYTSRSPEFKNPQTNDLTASEVTLNKQNKFKLVQEFIDKQQLKEEERLKHLATIEDLAEKEKLENLYAIKRAKASEKIDQLIKKHKVDKQL